MPSDFTDVSILDFFAADRTLVTLVEAVKRDDHGDKSVPRDIRWMWSSRWLIRAKPRSELQ